MENEDKKLSNIRVVVTDADTGEVLVDKTEQTVFIVMSDYEDREKNGGKITAMQYINGEHYGIAEMLMHGKALRFAKMAVTMAIMKGEKEDDD